MEYARNDEHKNVFGFGPASRANLRGGDIHIHGSVNFAFD